MLDRRGRRKTSMLAQMSAEWAEGLDRQQNKRALDIGDGQDLGLM